MSKGSCRYAGWVVERTCVVGSGISCGSFALVNSTVPIEPRHVASLYRPVECPLVRRKKGTLQEGSEVLRCCLLRTGYKAGKLLMT